MLMPKKTKYRKVQRGRMRGISRMNTMKFGEYGLQAIDPGWLTSQQIESLRMTISKKLKKVGKTFIRVFPQKPYTKKPAETRMGKGKGSVEGWVAVVKRECIICEISGLDEVTSKAVLHTASSKLPIRVRFVKREQFVKPAQDV